MQKNKAYLIFKHVMDRIIAFFSIIALGWVFLAIIIAIAIDSKGKVIFTQLREGYNRELFGVYKFRTMKTLDVKFDKNNPVITDANKNVTKVGRFLRKYKLDELPQLFNILRGEMSFIGPRPLMPVYSEGYEKWEYRKFAQKPGMTGLAQTRGNGYLSIKARSYYDALYNENVTLGGDIKILLKTIAIIFRGEKYFLDEPDPALIEAMKEKYNNDDDGTNG